MSENNNNEPISRKDVAEALQHILDAIEEIRSETSTSVGNLAKKLSSSTVSHETMLRTLGSNVSKKIASVRSEISTIGQGDGSYQEYELTAEDKAEIVSELKKKLPKERFDRLESDFRSLRDEVLRIKTANSFSSIGGIDIPVPFEVPIIAGTNITVTKSPSGAYIISATAGISSIVTDGITILGNGTSSNPLRSGFPNTTVNEFVGTADGVQSVFPTQKSFVYGTTAIYLNGIRQVLGIDYYEVTSSSISFSAGSVPPAGGILTADYANLFAVAVPSNGMLTENGSSLLTEDGSYLLIES